MQFLFPSFLWALLSLSVPIIIHLFYFRRFKKVYFTNVKYLKEIKEETSNRNKLKNLLVLLARCLAVAALVLAFAQPFIPKGGVAKSGINNISVFIDNSYSMTSTKDDIPLIDYSKDKARSIINSYGDADQFQILTHDFEGRHQRILSKEDALMYINDIQITPDVQLISTILNRQRQLFENAAGNKISYIISDFQKSITDLSNYQDTLMEVNLVPVQSVREKNISVDSVWFEGPVPFLNQNNKLLVRIRNNSPEDAEQIKVSFIKDAQEKPVGLRDITANSYITDTINLSLDVSGWHQAVVQVSDYPVQFDDKYFISFNVPDTVKALFINDSDGDKFMTALFNGVKNFSLSNQNVNQLQYQKFQTFDIIMLNDLKTITSGLSNELLQYLRNGGKVLVFPGKSAELSTYNNFMSFAGGNMFGNSNISKREVSQINTEEFIFSDVYINTGGNLKLPVTSFSYNFNVQSSIGEEKLLTYRDGGSFLSKYRIGDGQLFVCASPLSNDINDLVYNAEVFVPLIYKMAISTIKQKPIAFTINNNLVINTENKRMSGDFVYKVTDGKNEIIPGQIPTGNLISLDLSDQIKHSGFYDLLLSENIESKLAFNYDRRESDMTLISESGLEGINPANVKIKLIPSVLQANISGAIYEKDKGIVLWKWFAIFALLFLAIESLLIRYFKN
ncbi:MAG: BatA domain-containing protein [Saprospiraceae bacterium]|nr:BatA domain-containing protein [Saprospiraceae bacterium]MBL0026083.1 BatA domain-containing protein [Saprospiraceae bacterium]